MFTVWLHNSLIFAFIKKQVISATMIVYYTR